MRPVPLQGRDVPRAAATLARAFSDEPLTVHMFPDRAQRGRLLPGHFERVLTLGLAIGEVWCSPSFEAVACWLAPGSWPPTDAEVVASGLDRGEELLGPDVWQRFRTVYEAIDVWHGRIMKDPHWDLWVIGVEPEARGRGLARGLLEPLLQRADRSGESCYLETLDAQTLSLYARLGFDVHVAEVETTSGLPFWCCVRPPSRPTGPASQP